MAAARLLVAAVLLAALVTAAFWPVIGCTLINYDDRDYVLTNRQVLEGLTWEGVRWAFTTGHMANWHPLTWISHMLDQEFFGAWAGGHHLTNLVFHVANTLLLLLVLKSVTGRLWPSALVAALFGVHPLHVESVAWVSERKDVLGALFWMLTTGAYLGYVKRPGPRRYLAALLAFALGLLSKPMLVTLPFVLLLLDWWPLGRLRTPLAANLPRLVSEKIPLFLLSAGSSVVTYMVQSRDGSVIALDDLSFGWRAANALAAYAIYLWKTVWPAGLAVFYPHPGTALPAWQAVAGFLALAAGTATAVALRRGRPHLIVGWLWFLGTLVPVIGIVQVGLQAVADRYTYLPLIGLFVGIAWSVPRPVGRWRRPALAAGVAALLAVLGAVSRLQAGYWRDDVVLFSHALEVTERNFVAHANLGLALIAGGKRKEGLLHLVESNRIRPASSKEVLDLASALGWEGLRAQAQEMRQLGLALARSSGK